MVSSNKILTVSYGTFSCTLEGFDNSFDTMKAIAEYFRDLAQDDRYFGAEPPTPDAEMLARIAEREIARRVEARFEKGNLVLRPSEDSEPPRGDVASESSKAAGLVGAAAGAAATSLAVADTREDWDAEPVEDEAGQDEPATAVSDEALPDVTAADDMVEADQYDVAEDEDDAPLMVADDPAEDMVIEATTEDVGDDEPVAAPQPAADSVADKLQRIRAVVASKTQSDPEYIEDEHAMLAAQMASDTDLEAAPSALPDAAMAGDDLDTEDDNLFTDTIAALVSDQIFAEEDDDEDALLPDLPDETDEDEFTADPQSEIDALRARIAELESRAASAQTPHIRVVEQDDLAEDNDDDLVAEAADDSDDDTAEEDDEPLVLEDSSDDDMLDDADEAPIVARVAKVKRSDFEAAIAAGQIEEYEDDEDGDDDDTVATSAPAKASDDGKLTPEEEEELAREMARLQAEIDEDEDWDFDIPEDRETTSEDEDRSVSDAIAAMSEEDEIAAESNIRKAVKMTNPGRAMLTETPIEEDDDSVERLIDQTETEMDEPEGNRRRSAIAHLRAAVAATKADRLLGLGKKPKNEEKPYREDLADAVRPRRPTVTQAKSERPAPVRPAPLKLVAEQRIDVAQADASPVRPRRVMRSVETVEAQDDMVTSGDTGFAEFAEKVGAHTLPELLEAAAAYMSFVEGRDQFSRPQLMTKLHQAEGEASSREERLRSFGQLLREGKIEKTGGGRFTASDSIGYKPGARAAG